MIPKIEYRQGNSPVNTEGVDLTGFKRALTNVGQTLINQKNSEDTRAFGRGMRDISEQVKNDIRQAGFTAESMDNGYSRIEEAKADMIEKLGITDVNIMSNFDEVTLQSIDDTKAIILNEQINDKIYKGQFEMNLSIENGEKNEVVTQIANERVEMFEQMYKSGMVDQKLYQDSLIAIRGQAVKGNFSNEIRRTMPPLDAGVDVLKKWLGDMKAKARSEEWKVNNGGRGDEHLEKMLGIYENSIGSLGYETDFMNDLPMDVHEGNKYINALERQYGGTNDAKIKSALKKVTDFQNKKFERFTNGRTGEFSNDKVPLVEFTSKNFTDFTNQMVSDHLYKNAEDVNFDDYIRYGSEQAGDTGFRNADLATFPKNSDIYQDLDKFLINYGGNSPAEAITAFFELQDGNVSINGREGNKIDAENMKMNPLYEVMLENTLFELRPDLPKDAYYMAKYGDQSNEMSFILNNSDYDNREFIPIEKFNNQEKVSKEMDKLDRKHKINHKLNILARTDADGKQVSHLLQDDYKKSLERAIALGYGEQYASMLSKTIDKNNPTVKMADGTYSHLDNRHRNLNNIEYRIQSSVSDRVNNRELYYLDENGNEVALNTTDLVKGTYDRYEQVWKLEHRSGNLQEPIPLYEYSKDTGGLIQASTSILGVAGPALDQDRKSRHRNVNWIDPAVAEELKAQTRLEASEKAGITRSERNKAFRDSLVNGNLEISNLEKELYGEEGYIEEADFLDQMSDEDVGDQIQLDFSDETAPVDDMVGAATPPEIDRSKSGTPIQFPAQAYKDRRKRGRIKQVSKETLDIDIPKLETSLSSEALQGDEIFNNAIQSARNVIEKYLNEETITPLPTNPEEFKMEISKARTDIELALKEVPKRYEAQVNRIRSRKKEFEGMPKPEVPEEIPRVEAQVNRLRGSSNEFVGRTEDFGITPFSVEKEKEVLITKEMAKETLSTLFNVKNVIEDYVDREGTLTPAEEMSIGEEGEAFDTRSVYNFNGVDYVASNEQTDFYFGGHYFEPVETEMDKDAGIIMKEDKPVTFNKEQIESILGFEMPIDEAGNLLSDVPTGKADLTFTQYQQAFKTINRAGKLIDDLQNDIDDVESGKRFSRYDDEFRNKYIKTLKDSIEKAEKVRMGVYSRLNP